MGIVNQQKRGGVDNFKKTKAKDLWKKILRSLFETSHPWVTFKDPSNLRYSNQHEGVVHSSNLCTEILLHTKPSEYAGGNKIQEGETAVCNLASINLKSHLVLRDNENWDLDWDKLASTIYIAMRGLDNVIDLNFYPTRESSKSNFRHRPVGLGVMGLHDVFHKLNILIDSDEAISFNDKLFEFYSREAILSSSKLAAERGSYSSYKGSLWDQDVFPIDTYNSLMRYRGSARGKLQKR